jgi:LmbE family N-acetylglucosaminyl deacetylase
MNSANLFVVSPHLDDAVFSCGMLLAAHPGATVCTVFAGAPAVPMSTEWDRRAGFPHSDAAMRARWLEDERALEQLGAAGMRLPFLDAQYGPPPSADAVASALVDAWQACHCPCFVAPLGLYHSDHMLVSDACCALLARSGMQALMLYEDALYRRFRHLVPERREALAARGFKLEPGAKASLFSMRHNSHAATQKWRSVRAYRSQLRALADAHPNDLAEPERFWRLSWGGTSVPAFPARLT